MACRHEAQHVDCKVGFMEDTGQWMAEIQIVCSLCQMPFRFLGLEAGLSFARPMVSIDGLELLAPIEPEGEKRLQRSATYELDTPLRFPSPQMGNRPKES